GELSAQGLGGEKPPLPPTGPRPGFPAPTIRIRLSGASPDPPSRGQESSHSHHEITPAFASRRHQCQGNSAYPTSMPKDERSSNKKLSGRETPGSKHSVGGRFGVVAADCNPRELHIARRYSKLTSHLHYSLDSTLSCRVLFYNVFTYLGYVLRV